MSSVTEANKVVAQQKVLRNAWFKKIGYVPHSGQDLYHDSLARFRVAVCGRRYGKTSMAAKDLEPKLLLPNRRYWIVGPTYSLGEKEFRVIWNDMIIKQKLGRDPRVKKAYSPKQGTMYIEFTDRNTILEVKSADNTDTLVGDSLDGVIMSEAAKHKKETWDRYIRPALSDKRGFADFPTTPEGFNWLYDLWLLGKDDGLVDYESWRFPSWMNKFVYPDGETDSEIQLLRRTMTPESFEQEIAADFSSFSGKIYPEWDISTNVKTVDYNPAWPNYIAFDWGYTNPLAAIEFQVSPDDKIYIWREHYRPLERVETHLKIMKEREQPDGYHINMCFGDAADPEAVRTVNETFAPCVADPNAKTNWRAGVDLVRGFLNRADDEDEFGGPIYSPALFVDPSCVNVIREFNNYRAPESTKGRNVTEMGIKQDDHALDALRYGLVHVFTLGATSSLSDTMDITPLSSPVVTKAKLDQVDNGFKRVLPGMESDLVDLMDKSSTTEGYFTSIGDL